MTWVTLAEALQDAIAKGVVAGERDGGTSRVSPERPAAVKPPASCQETKALPAEEVEANRHGRSGTDPHGGQAPARPERQCLFVIEGGRTAPGRSRAVRPIRSSGRVTASEFLRVVHSATA